MGERVEKVVSKDGTTIACWVSGAGPPLVAVHGTTGDHVSWAMVAPLLADRFRLYILDRRGRGESGDAEPYAIEREFEDVAAVVDSIGGPVFLYGHSLGADIALHAALLTPNVAKLILYEPDAGLFTIPDEDLDRLDTMLEEGRRDELLETMLREIAGLTEEEIAAFKASPMWQLRLAAVNTVPRELRVDSAMEFTPREFAQVTAPTMLLLGTDSPEWARKGADAVAEALPRARIVALEGQGHAANTMAPELLARKIADFLAV